MVTSSPGLIAGSYVLHRLLTPRHPSHALIDLIASTECRSYPMSRMIRYWLRSRPHLHDGVTNQQCCPAGSQSPRCSYLGAITHCALHSELEIHRQAERTRTEAAAQYRDNLHTSSLVKDLFRTSIRLRGSNCGGAMLAIPELLSMPLHARLWNFFAFP